MTIPPWRLALAAGTLVVLGAIGGGLVQAAATLTAPSANPAAQVATVDDAADLRDVLALSTDPTSSSKAIPAHLLAVRDRLGGRLAGWRQHLVHATLTVLDRDGKLVTLQLDHGTVASVGSGSITIAEAGGTSITVATTAETRVRKERKPATLADLKVGDEVVVQSIVDGGSPTARWVVVPAERPTAAAPSNGGNG
jgi:preprotein translocase subunit YajC